MSRILVAEDDPHILRLISMWLRRQGHEVLEARNGLLAWELVQQELIDVLVSDVNMPGMDGLELIAALRRDNRVQRGVIVLTNRWDHTTIRDQLAQWGVHVLPKPFSPSRLSELVDALLGRNDPPNQPATTGEGASA
jgi:DNA-binding response OmpR family regulator